MSFEWLATAGSSNVDGGSRWANGRLGGPMHTCIHMGRSAWNPWGGQVSVYNRAALGRTVWSESSIIQLLTGGWWLVCSMYSFTPGPSSAWKVSPSRGLKGFSKDTCLQVERGRGRRGKGGSRAGM